MCNSKIFPSSVFQRSLLLSILFSLFLLVFSCLQARIAIYGDTRSNPDIHKQIVKQIATFKPEAIFHTGDLNSSGKNQKEYDTFFQIISPLTQFGEFYPARGNHEKDLSLFLKNFPYLNGSSYYTVMYDSIRFIILDSVLDLSPTSEQYCWLHKQLQEKIPSLLILHHPVFSSGEHSDELGLHLFLPELLQQSSVKVVFSAHDHNYERSEYNNITYIVTGGGGAPLREIYSHNPYSLVFSKQHHYIIAEREGPLINFKVYALSGDIIDTFLIGGF